LILTDDIHPRQGLAPSARPADVFDPLGELLRTFGPFVIPVAVFVAGLVGYAVLVALGRAGLVGTREAEEETEGEGWRRR
jgi:hypothetical protein